MKKNLKPASVFYPLPVLIIATYDKDLNPNAMNAAWGGIHDTNEIVICLAPDHKTTENIKLHKEFTVSFGVKELVTECDYLGLASGNKVSDKIAHAGLHTVKSENVKAPVITEFPLTLELKAKSIDEIEGSTFVVGSIVNILADDSILDSNGKIDYTKAHFISYEPSKHLYVEMGEACGNAFKDGVKLMK